MSLESKSYCLYDGYDTAIDAIDPNSSGILRYANDHKKRPISAKSGSSQYVTVLSIASLSQKKISLPERNFCGTIE